METKIDCDVRLRSEEKFSGLYSWCIEEFDKAGNKLGIDYIPWPWSLPFDVSSLKVTKYLEKNAENNSDIINTIHCILTPSSSNRQGRVAYSFFGTNRTIRDIHLRIRKSKSEAYCGVLGVIGYTADWDFLTEEVDDAIEIEVGLPNALYDEINTFIAAGNVQGHLRMKGVDGFYSGWSPSSKTTEVKILTGDKELNLKVEDGLQIIPPTIGQVKEFSLQFTKNDLSIAVKTSENVSFEGESEYSLPAGNPTVGDRVENVGSRFSALERKISRMSIPLWIAAAALVIDLIR